MVLTPVPSDQPIEQPTGGDNILTHCCVLYEYTLVRRDIEQPRNSLPRFVQEIDILISQKLVGCILGQLLVSSKRIAYR